MKQKQFTDYMAKKYGLTKKEADIEIKRFLNTLLECLEKEGEVRFIKFGKFKMMTAKEKKARNPRTGDPHIVPEHKSIKFKISRYLRNFESQ